MALVCGYIVCVWSMYYTYTCILSLFSILCSAVWVIVCVCVCVFVCIGVDVTQPLLCRSAVCCHGCPSEDGLLSAISDSFLSKSQLEGIRAELEFGHVNGSLLQFPTPQPAADCAVQDSNLQSVIIHSSCPLL